MILTIGAWSKSLDIAGDDTERCSHFTRGFCVNAAVFMFEVGVGLGGELGGKDCELNFRGIPEFGKMENGRL